MPRLIDANSLKSKLQEHHDFFVDAWRGFSEMTYATKCRVDEIDNCIAEIVNAPTVDAVEVVRCKDCKMEYGCRVAQWLGEDGYCSYGERKDNE